MLLSTAFSSTANANWGDQDTVQEAPQLATAINPHRINDAIVLIRTVKWNEAVRQNQAKKPIVRKTVTPKTGGAVQDGDFWRRLANCENADGSAPGGYFQFMGETRAKVGWAPGQSYETQRSEAIWWAQQIHPNEGTSAGWPHCWWVAQNG